MPPGADTRERPGLPTGGAVTRGHGRATPARLGVPGLPSNMAALRRRPAASTPPPRTRPRRRSGRRHIRLRASRRRGGAAHAGRSRRLVLRPARRERSPADDRHGEDEPDERRHDQRRQPLQGAFGDSKLAERSSSRCGSCRRSRHRSARERRLRQPRARPRRCAAARRRPRPDATPY